MNLNGRSVRIFLLTLALTAIGVNVYLMRLRDADISRAPGAASSISTAGESVPGNPEATERSMRLFHEKMLIYKRKYGRLPMPGIEPDFSLDMATNFREYGFSTPQAAIIAFRNPDTKYADGFNTLPHPEEICPYVWVITRPNGSKASAAPSERGRDPLLCTDIYFHHNSRKSPDGSIAANLTGFYLILWDNGQLQRVPHNQARFVYPRPAGSSPCFPGQAGVPERTYTYDEYWQKVKPFNADGSNPNLLTANKPGQ